VTAESNEVIEEGPTEMSDALLVSKAKSGDPDAFVELSKRHYRRVFYETYRITRNWQDAEDALQDSLLKAFCHLNNFQERSSFSTWLTRIAINSALMILRKKRNCRFSLDGTDDPGGKCERWETQSLAEDPESSYARREREALLREAILRLPPRCREAVELWRAREYSEKEIAQALGISVNAVKARLLRARLTLRADCFPPIRNPNPIRRRFEGSATKCSNHGQRSSSFRGSSRKI
jgi:RNA polymerase sigma-70 factor, ECF subfamily